MFVLNFCFGTLSDKSRAIGEISEATECFGDSLVFSVLTGSAAVPGESAASDLDVLTVVTPFDGVVSVIKDFARRHVAAQMKNGFVFDRKYPTDVISTLQLRDVVDGRGVEVCSDDVVALVSNHSPDELLDYRIWLYELISHNLGLINGDVDALLSATKEALHLTFMLSVSFGAIVEGQSAEELRSSIFEPAGLRKKVLANVFDVLCLDLQRVDFAYLAARGVEFDRDAINATLLKKLGLLSTREVPEYLLGWDELRAMFG